MTVTPAYETDDAFGFVSATDAEVGICLAPADCDSDGVLISNNELKTEFRSRDFIQDATGVDEQIMIGKAQGASSSVYACYIPLSKSSREKACEDGKVYTLSAADGTRTKITAGDATCAADSVTWTTGPQYVCIPE